MKREGGGILRFKQSRMGIQMGGLAHWIVALMLVFASSVLPLTKASRPCCNQQVNASASEHQRVRPRRPLRSSRDSLPARRDRETVGVK